MPRQCRYLARELRQSQQPRSVRKRQPRPESSSPCRAASTARWWRRCWPSEGYDVVGVTLQLYDHGAALARKGACCAGRDIHDARRVAEAMGFPHYVLDYESRFRAERDRGVRRRLPRRRHAGALHPLQRAGEVPRPARRPRSDLEADCMATGHYVRRVEGPARAGAAPGGRSGPRPELFPVLDHAGRSSASCAFRSAGSRRRPRPGRWRRATGCRSPTSPTARTSASCRTAPMPR